MDTHVVVLAAGKGTRMKSARPKVLHRVAGRPMIEHVLATAATLQPATTTVVVGHEADASSTLWPGIRVSPLWCRSHSWAPRTRC